MGNKGACTTCKHYKYDCGHHFIDYDGHINYNIPRESMYDGVLGDIPSCWEPSEQYKNQITNERINFLVKKYSVDELKQALAIKNTEKGDKE